MELKMRKCDGMCGFQHSQCDPIKTQTSTSVWAVTEQFSLFFYSVHCLFKKNTVGIHLDLRIMKEKQKAKIRLSRILTNTIIEVLAGILAAVLNALIKCGV